MVLILLRDGSARWFRANCTNLKKVGNHDRLEDVQLKVAVGAANRHGDMVAHHLSTRVLLFVVWSVSIQPSVVCMNDVCSTCAHTMVMASHWVGFTLPARKDCDEVSAIAARTTAGPQHLPGMMEEPGSFSGSDSSPSPQRGPEPRKRRSLAIFMREHAMVFSAPLASTVYTPNTHTHTYCERHHVLQPM